MWTSRPEEPEFLVHPSVETYLKGWVHRPHPVFREVEQRAEAEGFPIVGPVVGRLLYQLTLLVKPRRIFELGSGYGYSALWFVAALPEGAEIFLTDYDARNLADARRYLGQLGRPVTIHALEGDALAHFRETPGPFDLVYADIEKTRYPEVADLAYEKLRPGGLLLADNLLWRGRVLPPEAQDEKTRGILAFTRRIFQEDRWVSTIIPIRDGVSVSVRR